MNPGYTYRDYNWAGMVAGTVPGPILGYPLPVRNGCFRHVITVFLSFPSESSLLRSIGTSGLSERGRIRGPGYLVSGADWMPGTARAPVSLSLYNYEG